MRFPLRLCLLLIGLSGSGLAVALQAAGPADGASLEQYLAVP